MALSTDDGQSACCLHLGRELDIGTTTCHVGGNGDGTQLALLLADFIDVDVGIFLVALCQFLIVTERRGLVAIGCSIGRYPYIAHGRLSGKSHDVGLSLVQLGIQHLVGNVAQFQHTAEQL